MSLSLRDRCKCLSSRRFQSLHLYLFFYLQSFLRYSNPASIVYPPYSPFFPLPVCTVDGVFFHNTLTPNHHNSSCHVFQ